MRTNSESMDTQKLKSNKESMGRQKLEANSESMDTQKLKIYSKFSRKDAMKFLKKMFDASREMFISLLFPSRCPVCDEILAPEETEKGIHLACKSKLFPVEGAVCMHCGRPLGQVESQKFTYLERESVTEYCTECHRKGYVPVSIYENQNYRRKLSYDMQYNASDYTISRSNIAQAKSLFLYKGVIKNVMYRFKYANKREYARFFAKLAVEKYGDWLGVERQEWQQSSQSQQKGVELQRLGVTPSEKVLTPSQGNESSPKSQSSQKYQGRQTSRSHQPTSKPQVIVPVPMYDKKKKLRGYNQAEVFAEELSKRTGIPVDKDYIRRIKDTTPQKELDDIQRKNNLEKAFQKGKSIVQYMHVLVVDDIYTTGYTAEAVAKELKKQGVHHIYLLSVCIGGNGN